MLLWEVEMLCMMPLSTPHRDVSRTRSSVPWQRPLWGKGLQQSPLKVPPQSWGKPKMLPPRLICSHLTNKSNGFSFCL